jgi:hypothetical protein
MSDSHEHGNIGPLHFQNPWWGEKGLGLPSQQTMTILEHEQYHRRVIRLRSTIAFRASPISKNALKHFVANGHP